MEKLNLYDGQGEPVDYDSVQRITLICFKCTNYLTEKGGILFSEPTESFSDNVDKVDKFHLCKKCVNEVLVFCGAEPKEQNQ